jgi:hypothetical protein
MHIQRKSILIAKYYTVEKVHRYSQHSCPREETMTMEEAGNYSAYNETVLNKLE